MATEHAMATMEKEAQDRIDAALATLSAQLQIEIPPEQFERADARMKQVRSLQRQATILDLIVDALGLGGVKRPTSSDEPAKPNLTRMKRDELNVYALEHGIDDPKAFARKEDLIDALEGSAQVAADQAAAEPTDEAEDDASEGTVSTDAGESESDGTV